MRKIILLRRWGIYSSDINLLRIMVEYVIKNNDTPCIKINSMDVCLREF